MIEFVESTFVTSAPDITLAPENAERNEVAFMARSNAGKSSLLNAIANHKNLAKVSSTPGKTRLINFFDAVVMDRESGEKRKIVLVDLPGFGYAKVSKSLLHDWEKNLTDFISRRGQVKLFIHLIDARHPDLEIDRSVQAYLEQIRLPHQHILRVFTKADKLNQKELGALMREHPGTLVVSSSKKRGIAKLVAEIYRLIKDDFDADHL